MDAICILYGFSASASASVLAQQIQKKYSFVKMVFGAYFSRKRNESAKTS
jgi:hypothetical protein